MNTVRIIAAVGDKNLLGLEKNGVHSLPWHIPEDLKHFSAKTKDSVVIMGRATWESLPEKYRPLPHRVNIVLSRDSTYETHNSETKVCTTIEEALAHARSLEKPIWIIGGARIYAQALPFVDELHLTHVLESSLPKQEDDVKKILFPEYQNLFRRIEESEYKKTDMGISYRFEIWSTPK